MVVEGVVLVEVEVVVVTILIVVGVLRWCSVQGPTGPLISFAKRAGAGLCTNPLSMMCSSARSKLVTLPRLPS